MGLKKVFIANRDQPLADDALSSEANAPFVRESERRRFLSHLQVSQSQTATIYLLLDHGSEKLLSSASPAGEANFDVQNRPLSPLTKQPIVTWYKNGATYDDVFEDLATSMECCRAECVGAYLIFNSELLAMFGYTEKSEVKASDCKRSMIISMYKYGRNDLPD